MDPFGQPYMWRSLLRWFDPKGSNIKLLLILLRVVKSRWFHRASSFVSNTFHFVFGFNENVALRKVLPLTIEEASALVIIIL